jgi:hypothetical protein
LPYLQYLLIAESAALLARDSRLVLRAQSGMP